MNKDIFKQGQKASLFAASITVSLAVTKGIVGFISGSVVLMGDSVHSFADSFSSFAAWLGLKIAKKEPTEEFPYGFYKVENITAFLISLLILFAGYSIIKESINKIFVEYKIAIPMVAVGVALVDAIVMFLVGTYEVKVGRKINSQSLIADGRESRMHLFSSSVVLFGLIAAVLGIPYLEGIAGVAISLFIFKAGIESAKDSIFSLIDVSPDPAVEKKIKDILNKVSGLRGYQNLKLRKSGPLIFGEVEGRVGKNINIKRANEISNSIEKEIKKKVRTVDSFTVSFSPFETKKQKICIPVKNAKGLSSEISSHFGRAPLFLFVEIEDNKVNNHYFKENPYKNEEKRAGLKSCDYVIGEKIDSIITKEMGPISFHILRDNIVDVYQAIDGIAQEIVNNYSEKKLNFLKEPTREKI